MVEQRTVYPYLCVCKRVPHFQHGLPLPPPQVWGNMMGNNKKVFQLFHRQPDLKPRCPDTINNTLLTIATPLPEDCSSQPVPHSKPQRAPVWPGQKTDTLPTHTTLISGPAVHIPQGAVVV